MTIGPAPCGAMPKPHKLARRRAVNVTTKTAAMACPAALAPTQTSQSRQRPTSPW